MKNLALFIFAGDVKNIAGIEKEGYTLRKNKTISDVNNAIRKSKKNGMGKTEYELDMLELYLNDVLKKKKI